MFANLMNKLKKTVSTSPRFPEGTMIDVRGMNGFTNHLITAETFEASHRDAEPLDALLTLCGHNRWLLRQDHINPAFVILPEEDARARKDLCRTCVAVRENLNM